MPQVIDIIRLRRKRGASSSKKTSLGLALRAALGSLSLVLLLGLLVIAFLQAQITADLPPVTALETHFGEIGRERYEPVQFYDRSGEVVLYEARHPKAEGARWLYIQEQGPIDIREYTLQAILAATDPDYFTRPRPNVFQMAKEFFRIWLQGASTRISTQIPRMLTEEQLYPLGRSHPVDNADQASKNLLAQELSRRYSKSQILEWFVNSGDFGRDAYGLDAAALVYLGKHASDLSLGESALLAPILLQPMLNPLDAPEESRERQERLLDDMVELSWITQAEAWNAKREELIILEPESAERSPLQTILADWLQDRLGEAALNRSGLNVYTTIDAELQLQAECTLATQLKRLNGGLGNETVPASDGSACLAASLLPPMRPSDQGVEHQVDMGAFMIIDPKSGEILALAGEVGLDLPADAVLSPLIYLTAFSQGYGPGSMVLDLPPTDMLDPSLGELSSMYTDAQGPVRIRTALANLYPFAMERVLNLVGEGSVSRIAQNLGIRLDVQAENTVLEGDRWQVSLLDLSTAYGVLAYQGQRVGTSSSPDVGNGPDLQPEILYEVEDGNRKLVYRYRQESSAVVSPQLAYLINDILSDEPARWPLYGTGNPLEIGRPTASIGGMSNDGHVSWTVGYSPSIVVGVWMGNPGVSAPQEIGVTNSAGAVWHAVMQYAARSLPPQDWTTPPGVSSIEVCDPSGLLPTVYCPEIVREVFLSGTEPTTFDNLYQPFRVNQETGKLATLYTPLDQVEERVYMVPPPEALAWAEAVGLEQPPNEYDTLVTERPTVAGVEIRSPTPFAFVRGIVLVRGRANIDGFDYYRMQYGEGLNPSRWIQVGEEVREPVQSGMLGRWDTSGLDGLYTLQLIVVDQEDQLATASVNITIDNQPPELDIILPEEGQQVEGPSGGVVLQVDATDNYGVASVSFYVDGQLLATLSNPPYSTRWRESIMGEHSFYVEARDSAGNVSKSQTIVFDISDSK
jgi:membrane carboxypeptidase/penicillin-binding protein